MFERASPRMILFLLIAVIALIVAITVPVVAVSMRRAALINREKIAPFPEYQIITKPAYQYRI
ncbi:hypothetical protein KKD72_02190 [Patescibacteria group bacterium]|nr:hypothetical protein [Patescibacteria group bacterium]